LAENTDDLFVGKTLLHGDVLMWLMKPLLTSRCINQRGAGQSIIFYVISTFCKFHFYIRDNVTKCSSLQLYPAT
ncbi:hypothetical protein EHJ00_10480, partial [Cronobacter sakazakii]|nr:hypothetical protein [Cronobacter sakazakii]